MVKHNIYLDNAATTRPIAGAADAVAAHIDSMWYNPSALYAPAMAAEKILRDARQTVARPCGAKNVIFTSCGTEANNMVIFGGWKRRGSKPMHFITSLYEHPAAYEPFKILQDMGHAVDFVMPDEYGHISAEDVCALVRPDTALVSIMHVSNETGALNDIEAIASAVKQLNPNTLFHSDGVQGYLKCPVNMNKVDYYTVSAHKVHGFKGTGALLMGNSLPVKPYIHGGGQEKGMRSGTENTAGIAVFERAVANYEKHHAEYIGAMNAFSRVLRSELSSLDGAYILTPEVGAAPHITTLSIDGVRGETLMHMLEDIGIYISTGSACSSKKVKETRMKRSFRLSDKAAEGVIRISSCGTNTEEEAYIAANEIKKAALALRRYIRR